MTAEVSGRLKVRWVTLRAQLLTQLLGAAAGVVVVVLVVLDPMAAKGQTAPAARAMASTNAPVSKPTDAVARAKISRWKPIFRGVEVCEGSTEFPRRLQVRAVRINLREPTIDFLVTPRIGNGTNAWGGRTTSEFLAEFKCQAALNGSIFDVFVKKRGDPMRVEGLSVSRGDFYESTNRWDALLISTNRRAWIARGPQRAERFLRAADPGQEQWHDEQPPSALGRRGQPERAVSDSDDG